MSRTLFISDLHLDASRPRITGALADFLKQNTDCDALYILGDIFEVWVGDDDDSPLAAEIATLFRAFIDAGPSLYLMVGNRDFLLGEDFCAAIGATLLPDPTLIDLYGTPTLLMHGDSLCTADEEYMSFRATARNPDWQAQLMSQAIEERRALAAQLRSMSAESNSNKAEDIMDVTSSEVDREMSEAGVTQLIHGHTHRPGRHEVACGVRWVLGDWGPKLWYIEADEVNLNLININI